MVPLVGREGWISSRKYGFEMYFERLNGTFRKIVFMIVGWYELIISFIFVHGVFGCHVGFIVDNITGTGMTCGTKVTMS